MHRFWVLCSALKIWVIERHFELSQSKDGITPHLQRVAFWRLVLPNSHIQSYKELYRCDLFHSSTATLTSEDGTHHFYSRVEGQILEQSQCLGQKTSHHSTLRCQLQQWWLVLLAMILMFIKWQLCAGHCKRCLRYNIYSMFVITL